MKTCLIIYNPESGKKVKKHKLLKVREIIRSYNYKVTIMESRYENHIEKIVEDAPFFDLVLAIGGDGTYNELANGNLKRKKPLVMSILPNGSTNDAAHMYGMTNNIIKSTKLLMEGEVKNTDLLKANNKVFTYVMGSGKFLDVSYKTSRKEKSKFGYLAYIYRGFKSFFSKTKLFPVKVKIDGKIYKKNLSLFLISNSNRIAGFNFYNDTKLDDGKFEFLMTDSKFHNKIYKLLYYFFSYQIGSLPNFERIRTDNLEIRVNTRDDEFSMDGEYYSEKVGTYKISVVKNVSILMPKNNIDKNFLK